MAAAKNVGFAWGFNVHYEDEDPGLDYNRSWAENITEAGHLVRDMIYGSNMVASHLVHFYQLAALDFVDPQAPAIASLQKGPFCPRYGTGTAGSLPYDYWYRIPNPLNDYLVAQYVLALTFRRMCNQIGGIWGGRAPFVQGLTPGGVASSISQASIDKSAELLYEGGVGGTPSAPAAGTILKFIGTPFDFANWVNDTGGDVNTLPIIGTGTYGGTMLFDVVAVAMFYPEYFWLGNAYENFLAYGVYEKGDYATEPLRGLLGLSGTPDQRLLMRGRKTHGSAYGTGEQPLVAHQSKVYENIASSHYNDDYLGKWRHPLDGRTDPMPQRNPNHSTAPGYSWIKSPRYYDPTDTTYGGAVPYEVGPLARMQVNGEYFAGVLPALGYTTVPNLPGVFKFAGVSLPTYGAPGPDLSAVFGAGYPNLGPGGYNLTYTGDSCLDRYAARQIECWKIANAMANWLSRLQAEVGNVTSKTRTPGVDQYSAQSYGWTEAPRGALGHWMQIDQNTGKIAKYQCVVPSTWNASPRDVNGTPGPAEKAMENVYVHDVNNPLEILRVSHSWDFCTACAVHLVQPKDGKKVESVVHMEPTHI